MGKVITFSNQKGGVAKTTSTVMTAAYLSANGYKVLIVDADAQCNSSNFVASEFTDLPDTQPTLFHLIFDGDISIEDAIINTEFGDLLLGSRNMWDMDRSDADHGVLKEIIDEVKNNYDFVLVDTPPNLGWSQLAALYAADYVVIPTDADNLAVQNIPYLYNTICNVAQTNTSLQIAGILFTKIDSRFRGLLVEKQIMEDVGVYADAVGINVFDGYVRQAKSPLSRSSLSHSNMFKAKESHKVKNDYQHFAEQLLKVVK